MPHTYTNLLTHIIFSMKERAPVIGSELRPRLHAYVGGIVRELGGTLLTINGVADHIHLLVGLPPVLSISETLRVLKTNSSRWVHEEMSQRAFGWQSGYGAFSVSQSNRTAVSQYIAQQDEHHRKISFQEEYVAFLQKHGIDYDERYLWD